MAIVHTADNRVIRSVVFPERVPKSPHSILASTPIVKQPHTRPYRIVLIELQPHHFSDGKVALAVYEEFWDHHHIDKETGHFTVTGESWLGHGNYFHADQLHLALAKFADRAKTQAGYVESIYRYTPLAPQER